MKKERQLANCQSLPYIVTCNKGSFTPGQYYWYVKTINRLYRETYTIKDDEDNEIEFDSIEFHTYFSPYEINYPLNEWEIKQIRDCIKVVQLLCDDENKKRRLSKLHKKFDDLVFKTIEDMRDHSFPSMFLDAEAKKENKRKVFKLLFDPNDPRAVEFAKGFPEAEPYY